MDTEDFEGDGDRPVHERRLLKIRDAVETSCYPVAGCQHRARDLRLHGVDVVHQGRRRQDTTQVNGTRDDEDG